MRENKKNEILRIDAFLPELDPLALHLKVLFSAPVFFQSHHNLYARNLR